MPTPESTIQEYLRREVMERQKIYGPDMTQHDLIDIHKPKQPWDEIIVSARELAEGAFALLINEDFGFYNAYERMSPEQEKRIRHLLAEWLEKELLERY
jgi:hypothetical protein